METQLKKNKKIKNERYNKFLDHQEIELITEAEIQYVINNIQGNHVREARSLIITLFYTGARPNEILKIKGKNVIKEDANYLSILVPGSKGGNSRKIFLNYRKDLIKELYNYVTSIDPERYLFWNFKSIYIRHRLCKKGRNKGKIFKTTEYSDKLRYHFKKWFSVLPSGNIPPYFLRHNRFTQLASSDIPLENIRQLKGAKTMDSVYPYTHFSSKSAKEIARKMK